MKKQNFRLELTLLSTVLLFIGLFFCMSDANASAYEVNVDRPGSDYANFNLPSPDYNLCREACENDLRCKAFTYVKPGVQGQAARCWLKNAVPAPRVSDCCISGVKSRISRTDSNDSSNQTSNPAKPLSGPSMGRGKSITSPQKPAAMPDPLPNPAAMAEPLTKSNSGNKLLPPKEVLPKNTSNLQSSIIRYWIVKDTPSQLEIGVEYIYAGESSTDKPNCAILAVSPIGGNSNGSGIGYTPVTMSKGRNKANIVMTKLTPGNTSSDGFKLFMHTCGPEFREFYQSSINYRKNWFLN